MEAKFYGPFHIIGKIRDVAYKLQLPSEAQVHLIFHMSQLKKAQGDHPVVTDLPPKLTVKKKKTHMSLSLYCTRGASLETPIW